MESLSLLCPSNRSAVERYCLEAKNTYLTLPSIDATDNRLQIRVCVFLVLKRCNTDREKTNKKRTEKKLGFNVSVYSSMRKPTAT